jgi:ElaB/YqjD/DUF883 family membrane-anchored ribosome-binding protein
MTRKEYMQKLENQLFFMDEASRQATLEFYGEMLDDRMEDGMDEASAVAAMESPAEIAARLREEAPAQPKEDKKEAAPLELGDEALKFSSLVDSVLKSAQSAVDEAEQAARRTAEEAERTAQEAAEEAYRAAQEAWQQAEDSQEYAREDWEDIARKLNETADSVAKTGLDGLARKLREAAGSVQGQSADDQNGDYQQMIFSCPAEQLRAVRLECNDMPIQVKPVEGNDAKLIYYTCENDPYQAQLQNGVLTLQSADGGHSRKGRFSFSMLGGIIKLGWSKSAPTVELFLPPDALVDLLAHTGNCSIKVNGMNALCDTDLKTTNSRIALEGVTCVRLEARTTNARIVLEQVSAKQDIQCTTSNSRIESRQVKCGGNITLTTSNSRITAEATAARGELNLTTSNSSMDVNALSADTITLRTSNGSISGTLPGRMSDWAIESRTSNGSNSLPTDQPGEKLLRVRTSNGSIRIRFEET